MLPGESSFDRCTATDTSVGAERFADTAIILDCGHGGTLVLIAIRLDPSAQKIGVESVGERHGRKQASITLALNSGACRRLRRGASAESVFVSMCRGHNRRRPAHSRRVIRNDVSLP